MRARGWLPAKRREPTILLVALLLWVAFPSGSAGADADLQARIEGIRAVMQALHFPDPAVKEEPSIKAAQLETKAPAALTPGGVQAGLGVYVWIGGARVAQGVFDTQAAALLCDPTHYPQCTSNEGRALNSVSLSGDTTFFAKGEFTTLGNGRKVAVATAISHTFTLLLKPGVGRMGFPTAAAYSLGACGDLFITAFKRKAAPKAGPDFANVQEIEAWVTRENIGVKRDVQDLMKAATDALMAKGACAEGAELAFSEVFPTMVIQAVQDGAGQVPLVAGKSGVVVVTPILRGSNTPLDGVKITVRALAPSGQTYPLTPLTPQANTAKVYPEENLNRQDLSESGTFILPADKAVEGPLTLEVEAAAPGGSAVRNTSVKETVQLTFQRAPSLFVAYMNVCHLDQTQCPGPRIASAQELMSKIYPVGDKGGIKYERLPTKFPYDPWPKSWSLTDPNPDTAARSALS